MMSKTRVLFDDNGGHIRTSWFNAAYDDLGRLIGESYDRGTPGGQHSRSYEYDLVGNRTVKYEDGVRTDYSYAALASQHTNQLSAASISGATSVEYLYDTMGNLTDAYIDSNSNNQFDTASEDGKEFTWNLADQLIQVKVWSGGVNTDTVQYTYTGNGTGQMLDRTVSGTTIRFHWNGFSPYLIEEDSTEEYAYFGSSIRFDLGNGTLETSDAAHFSCVMKRGMLLRLPIKMERWKLTSHTIHGAMTSATISQPTRKTSASSEPENILMR